MTTGHILGLFLSMIALQAIVWGIIDFLAWRKGKQTFSQWVIGESRKRRLFAKVVFGILLFFQALLVWLYFHFELHEILK